MDFTKEQLSELICKHTEKENGLQDLMEIMLESLMVSERREYLQEEGLSGNKCNGYRPGRTYGHGRTLTFRIPRDRYGNFHPRILAILRDQEEECERLAGTLYTKGLTQEQVCHTRAQQHEEHAHERGGQDPAEKEGRHRDRQRRVEEHRSDRALQAPLLQQLHCQHTILSAIAAYCFFPQKPAVDVAFVDDGQLVLF